ncbi:hypothetical protein GQ53DRAFT_749830, partial [Thozetella sp. PMI_491]
MNPSNPDSVGGIPTSSCDPDASRILHWVQTGIHIIASDSSKRKRRDVGSISVPSYGEQDDATDDSDSTPSSTQST